MANYEINTVPAFCVLCQILTFVSAGKVHCLIISVSKTPENTHELIQKKQFQSQTFIISKDTHRAG